MFKEEETWVYVWKQVEYVCLQALNLLEVGNLPYEHWVDESMMKQEKRLLQEKLKLKVRSKERKVEGWMMEKEG